MTLVIDLIRALREPEYRDEVSEELEGDITDMVRLEAADEIERLRSLNAELVEALKLAEYAIGNAVKPDIASDMDDLRAWAESFFLPTARAALSRARSETPEGET